MILFYGIHTLVRNINKWQGKKHLQETWKNKSTVWEGTKERFQNNFTFFIDVPDFFI